MKRIVKVSLALLTPLLLLIANGVAFGQDLPPGPTTVHRSTLPGVTMQGEFELINLILDFAPGAATPMHTHGGPGIVTVLDGEMAFGVEGKPDQVLKASGVYLDLPGTHHTAANKSPNAARVSYFVLLPKGATLTTVAGGQGGELPPGPTTVHRSTLPGITMPGEFDMINLILDFAPGAATPAHNHGGPGIVTVLQGEMVFGVEGRPDLVAGPGIVYPDLPGTVHTAINKTSASSRVSYAVVVPKGAALTTVRGANQAPAQQPVSPPAEGVGMPQTGSTSLPLPLIAAMIVILLGLGLTGWGRLPNAPRR